MHDNIMQLPLGYASHKVIVNQKTEVIDIILLDANAIYEKITGLKKESIIGKTMTQLYSETDNDALSWVQYFIDVAITGVNREINIEIARRWYKITAFSPEKYYFSTVLQDITSEIKQIEDLVNKNGELEKASSDMEKIFNSTPNAMFLVKYEDGEFRYIKNNIVHQKMTGFSQAYIKGKTPVDAMGDEIGNAWLSHYRQCVASEKILVYEESLDFNGTKGDWLVSLTPVKENGIVTYLVGSRTNITEIKSLRRENVDLLRRLQSMFNEHSAVMLIIEPHTGRIINANPSACDFYGYTKEELLNLHIQDINIMSKEEVKRLRLQALDEKQEYFLFPHRLKSGEIRLVDVYSCPVTYGDETQLFSIIFDVTDREHYKEDLYREKELLSITLNSIGDGVVTTDNEGKLFAINKAAQEITGWNEEDARARLFTDVFRLINEDTGMEAVDPIASVLRDRKIVGLANHTVLLNKQNIPIPIADSAAPIMDEKGECYGAVMVFRDISKDREQQKQILYLSYHDPLTMLYNRRFIEEEIQRLDSPNYLPLIIIMGDVNGLKVTNDVFGHMAGDRLLQNVAKILEDNCRNEDIIARWGGDEFLMLLPRTGVETAQQTIQKLKSCFAENSEGTLQISVSLGYSVKTREEEDIQYVLQKAEELMYHQKLLEGRSYRNNIINTLLATLYEKSMETEEHAKRLKDYCYAIAEELNFTSEELNELSLLAILHDIGKVGIRMDVLQKPGPLTPEEWEEMKLHPEIGYRISQNTPELSIVSEYILSHHERWDGGGYPRGLQGEEIPLLCRILAVADSYDAMTSDRVYRKALSREAAVKELNINKGKQFDPEIVDIFVKVLDTQG